jgi:uncharacterized membrane protein YhaH (DUF805 family)
MLPFKRYTDFRGRSRRREFWWYALVLGGSALVFFCAVGVISLAVFHQEPTSSALAVLEFIWGLATILPNTAVAVRRLHDTGRSGWWLLLSFVPLIGSIVLIVFYCLDSQPGANKWGPNPKGLQAVTPPGMLIQQ